MRVKEKYGSTVLTVFIEPPSIDALKERLTTRGTDNPSQIQVRIAKAIEELKYNNQFDRVVLNDNIDQAVDDTMTLIKEFFHNP